MNKETRPPPQVKSDKPAPFTPETYTALVLDKKISHGAHRLWHLLRNYANDQGICWPGMRRLCHELGSSPNQVAKWRKELIAEAYLAVEDRRRGQLLRYHLCGGVTGTSNTVVGEPLPEPVTPGGKSVTGFSQSVIQVLPEPVTKPKEPNPLTEGGGPVALNPKLTDLEDWQLERDKERLENALRGGNGGGNAARQRIRNIDAELTRRYPHNPRPRPAPTAAQPPEHPPAGPVVRIGDGKLLSAYRELIDH